MKTLLPAVTALVIASASTTALAAVTGLTGGGQPFDNMQPSLVVTEVTPFSGVYPSRDVGFPSGDTLGFIYDFAGNFAPGTSLPALGQLQTISQNTALFSLIGTTYGGNGQTNFALPNPSRCPTFKAPQQRESVRSQSSAWGPEPLWSASPRRRFLRTITHCPGAGSRGRPAEACPSATSNHR